MGKWIWFILWVGEYFFWRAIVLQRKAMGFALLKKNVEMPIFEQR